MKEAKTMTKKEIINRVYNMAIAYDPYGAKNNDLTIKEVSETLQTDPGAVLLYLDEIISDSDDREKEEEATILKRLIYAVYY